MLRRLTVLQRYLFLFAGTFLTLLPFQNCGQQGLSSSAGVSDTTALKSTSTTNSTPNPLPRCGPGFNDQNGVCVVNTTSGTNPSTTSGTNPSSGVVTTTSGEGSNGTTSVITPPPAPTTTPPAPQLPKYNPGVVSIVPFSVAATSTTVASQGWQFQNLPATTCTATPSGSNNNNICYAFGAMASGYVVNQASQTFPLNPNINNSPMLSSATMVSSVDVKYTDLNGNSILFPTLSVDLTSGKPTSVSQYVPAVTNPIASPALYYTLSVDPNAMTLNLTATNYNPASSGCLNNSTPTDFSCNAYVLGTLTQATYTVVAFQKAKIPGAGSTTDAGNSTGGSGPTGSGTGYGGGGAKAGDSGHINQN